MKRTCRKCSKGEMTLGMVPAVLNRAGVTFETEIPGEVCSECGANTVDYKTLKAFEFAAARWIATSGLQSKEAFRFMRTALGLKAQVLATMLGTTKETVSRWENGKHAIDRPTFAALATLVIDASKGHRSTMRQRLETMAAAPAPPSEPVRLKVAA